MNPQRTTLAIAYTIIAAALLVMLRACTVNGAEFIEKERQVMNT